MAQLEVIVDVGDTPEPQHDAFAIVGIIFGTVGVMGIVLCCCSPILTMLTSGFCGLVATGCGVIANKQKSDSDHPESRTLANTAVALGIINLLIALLSVATMFLGMLYYLFLILQ